ncbi:MAG: CPBP family intramembrane glutamic endopeptidase [Planctomycetota bacterium]|nr:CPBP family intramembrane glutamic endopeptidase [Planctomycetota bacterium]
MLHFATIAQVVLSVLLLTCLATWFQLVRRREPSQSLLAMDLRSVVPWGLCHLLAALVLLTLFETIAVFLVTPDRLSGNDPAAASAGQTPPQAVSVALAPADLWATAGARLAMLTAAIILILVTVRPTPADLGISRAELLDDLRLGCRVFLMFGPPAYAIQMLLTVWNPESHPIIESLRAAPDAQLMIASVVSAVVAAPLQEEFLWRLLFQGWLEKLARPNSDPIELLVGHRRKSSATATDQAVAAWPILVSSSLFALLHLDHGPAAVALFFFAVGLGWVYQRTHRILPCITAHLLLNGCSLALLFLEIRFDGQL